MADRISHGLLFAESDTPALPIGLGVVSRKRTLSHRNDKCIITMMTHCPIK